MVVVEAVSKWEMSSLSFVRRWVSEWSRRLWVWSKEMRVILSNVKSEGTGQLVAEILILEEGVLSQGTQIKWLIWKTGIECRKVDGQVPKPPFDIERMCYSRRE